MGDVDRDSDDAVASTSGDATESPQKVTVSKGRIIENIGNSISPFDKMKPGKVFDKKIPTAFMPSTTREQALKISNAATIDPTASADVRAWAAVFKTGSQMTPMNNWLQDAVKREGSVWTNRPGSIKASYTYMPHNPAATRTLTSALARARQAVSAGAEVKIPLYASGFYVKLAPVADTELNDLLRAISAEKIGFGSTVFGLMYANYTAYSSRILFDFIMNRVVEHSVILKPGVELRDLIICTDFQYLVAGLAASVWPNGFQYTQPCVADPEKCNHVVEGIVDIKKMLYADVSELTPEQLAHMSSNTPKSHSLEAIEKYRADFAAKFQKEVRINDVITMKYKICTMNEWLDSSWRWVHNIATTYPESLIKDRAERSEFINQQANMTIMRQYAHLVAEIRIYDGENPESDPECYTASETIERMLDIFSTTTNVKEIFGESIKAFIDDSSISVVGIPSFICPACGSDQLPSDETDSISRIIPVDAIATFFTLVGQKLERAGMAGSYGVT